MMELRIYYYCLTILVGFIPFLCLNQINSAAAFNLENRLPIIKYGAPGTYFGYSVAEHFQNNTQQNWLLVGAPLGQNLQPNTTKSGALFKCPITSRHDDCVQVITDGILVNNLTLDEDDPKLDKPDFKTEIKDGQWMGVTVRSQGQMSDDGKAIVCAHRYIRIVGSLETGARYGRGLCYILENDLSYEDVYDPCKGRTVMRGHEDYGYCQVGTSGTILNDGTMILGAPGPFTWRGTIFVSMIGGAFLKRDKGQYSGPHTELTSPVDKYSYLGMAVTGGRYFSDKLYFAAGAPRANSHGEVVIYAKAEIKNLELVVARIIDGEQFGSSFGYELITADINGDNLDDLIVSAPFYFKRHEGGAVYIYQNKEYNLANTPTLKLFGKLESRFGLALANLGDINLDLCDDIAIGAPYEGTGAVYIHLGSKNGLSPEPSQVIRPSNLGIFPNKLVTFGSSLSGGNDLDSNGYPDILVGAYDSSAVVALLSRPIINIKTEIIGKELESINPEETGCAAYPHINLKCFSFKACCKILHGQDQNDLNLTYTIEAETFNSFKKFARVSFHSEFPKRGHIISNNITVPQNGELFCREETVFLKNNTRDIQSPIKFHLNYTIIEPPLPAQPLTSTPLNPILDQTEADRVFMATFQKDCGDDDTCVTELKLDAMFELAKERDNYIVKLGLHNEFRLSVDIKNIDEPAYESQLFVQHSRHVEFISSIKSIGVCNRFNDTVVACTIGNPMPRASSGSMTLRFDSTGLEKYTNSTPIEFKLFANSTSRLTGPPNNVVLRVAVVREAQLSISGRAEPQQSFYGADGVVVKEIKYFEELGKSVQHTYQIYNDGPWMAPLVRVDIKWPHMFKNEETGKLDRLLYLAENPTVESSSAIHCHPKPQDVNPLRLIKRPILLASTTAEALQTESEFSKSQNEFSSSSSSYEKTSLPNFPSPQPNRLRRDIEPEMLSRPENLTDSRKQEIIHLDCDKPNTICLEFSCEIFNMARKSEAFIRIGGVLVNSTLMTSFPRVDSVKIYSNARITLDAKYGILTDTSDDYKAVATQAYRELTDQVIDKSVSWWIYVLAIVGGLLLLALLSLCLYKIGFFKRKRPDPTLSGNLEKSAESKPFIAN